MTDAIKHDLRNDAHFLALVMSLQIVLQQFPKWRIDQALEAAREMNDAEALLAENNSTTPD